MSLSRLHVGLVLLASLVSCCSSPGPSQDLHVEAFSRAVTSGSPTQGDPAVVGILRWEEPARLRCTGTVISDRVVITAAHCNVQHAPEDYEIFFGSSLASGVRRVRLLDAMAHVRYDGEANYDLALLLLAEPASVEPMSLVTVQELAAPPPVPLRLVGFGDTGPEAADSGVKREGPAETTEVHHEYVILEADPALPCTGDSGGPVLTLSGSTEGLAAVISRGDAACGGYAKATRIDVHHASFIQPYLEATAPGSATDGDRCLFYDQCQGGLCLVAQDDCVGLPEGEAERGVIHRQHGQALR